jgi:hypothetical protein
MCALGGRPKEEGGHKRIDISLDKETRRKLEKFKKQGGNVSRFIEREVKPVLEKLDPGEQSVHVYRIEVYLSHEIINAVHEGDLEKVRVLADLAKAIDDYRKLAHIPPLTIQVDEEQKVPKKPSVKRVMVLYPKLNERERELCLDDYVILSYLKSVADPSDPEWREYIKQREKEFKLRWGGIVEI